ncbi:hypothetical protein HNQ52_002831 [Chiayiivirga flava]|uniref:SD-repeat containing protein B domain-containing protein n=2 Tax=Chiayiivirga flava TaxID=659595 RepID=A0A7W8DAQ1_9GAMM|nr:hypothetical protein [Chiayiivirga flava]
MAGVTVQLWNGAKTALLDVAITNASGGYTLIAPGPGEHRVRVLLPSDPGAGFAPKDQGGSDLTDSDINPSGTHLGFTDIYTFASNVTSINTIDAGIFIPEPITVGNSVWQDLDADGAQDFGEPGLANVSVQLWNSTKTSLLDTAITNSNGRYTLTAPGPGNYCVRVLQPLFDTVRFSPKDEGADDTRDSDINPTGTDFGFTDIYAFGTSVVSITSIDAGLVPFQPIGDRVWDDVDGDGVQDGEPGIGGVQVQLWNAERNDLIDATFTDAAGNYTLLAPGPDSYRVRVLLPGPRYSFSPRDQAGDAIDSDIHASGTYFGFTDPLAVGVPGAFDTTVDAGIAGNRVFANGFE